MAIETYASPGLRWGLLLEDHPRATHDFKLRSGTEIGIPEEYGGKGKFCVCTINIPGQEPIVAYKPVPERGKPDEWVVSCTKTLGRALKKAGYPDDLKDLRALVLWRQRDAEIEAIRGGHIIEAVPKPLEIEAGGRDADDDGEPDVDYNLDEEEPQSVVNQNSEGVLPRDDRIVDAEVVSPDKEGSGDRWETVVQEVESLSKGDRKEFDAFMKGADIPDDPNEWTDEDLEDIEAWLLGGDD
jgi:hypothetical protein